VLPEDCPLDLKEVGDGAPSDCQDAQQGEQDEAIVGRGG
jgi:hypothetical protein